jgi:hypothetical protein
VSALSEAQLAQMRAIARAYAPDLPESTCSEVLLMLYEVCEILGVGEGEIVRLFGRRAFGYLRHYGDRPVPPYPQLAPPPAGGAARPLRAWVWLEGEKGPRFALVDHPRTSICFVRALGDAASANGDAAGQEADAAAHEARP